MHLVFYHTGSFSQWEITNFPNNPTISRRGFWTRLARSLYSTKCSRIIKALRSEVFYSFDNLRMMFCICYSPLAYVDPCHCNMAHLFVELLKDSLNEYAYAAEIAGVHYKLENTMYGIFVSTAHIFFSNHLHPWECCPWLVTRRKKHLSVFLYWA